MEKVKPHLPWITLLVLGVAVGLVNPSFFNPSGLILLMADIVPLFIMALGMTFAIYIGGIDLSVQQLANMITVIATVYLASLGAGVAVVAILSSPSFLYLLQQCTHLRACYDGCCYLIDIHLISKIVNP